MLRHQEAGTQSEGAGVDDEREQLSETLYKKLKIAGIAGYQHYPFGHLWVGMRAVSPFRERGTRSACVQKNNIALPDVVWMHSRGSVCMD